MWKVCSGLVLGTGLPVMPGTERAGLSIAFGAGGKDGGFRSRS